MRHIFQKPIMFAAPYLPVPNCLIDVEESRAIMQECTMYEKPNILEIGTYKGGTTRNLALMAKALGGKVYTVDVLHRPDTLPPVQAGEVLPSGEIGCDIPENLADYIKLYLIRPHTAALNQLLYSLNIRFDIIFIDGDHSYEGVKLDYGVSKLYRNTTSTTFFHDVWWDVTPPPVDGPLRLVEELGLPVINLTHLAVERIYE